MRSIDERFAQWRLKFVEDEFENGFPLLSLVRGTSAYTFLEFFSTLDATRQRLSRSAFLKRFAFGNGQELFLDDEERAILDRFKMFHYSVDADGRTFVDARGSMRERQFWQESEASGKKRSSHGLQRRIIRAFGERAGEIISKSNGVIAYDCRIYDWNIRTIVDIDASNVSVTYGQTIGRWNEAPRFSFLSTCSLLGVSGQTEWNLFTVDDIDVVADEITTSAVALIRDWKLILNDKQ